MKCTNLFLVVVASALAFPANAQSSTVAPVDNSNSSAAPIVGDGRTLLAQWDNNAFNTSPSGGKKHGKKQKKNLTPEEQAKKEQRHQKNLQLYDANHDGKLDPQERSAMRADKQAKKARRGNKNK